MSNQEYEYLKHKLEWQEGDQVKYAPKFVNEISFRLLTDTQIKDFIVLLDEELRFRTIKKQNA